MVVNMGQTKTYAKSIGQLRAKMNKLELEYNEVEEKLKALLEKESELWVKKGECTICGVKDYTEWHHIISQYRCKEEGLEHYIKMRSNVVELCKPCHDLTTASLINKNREVAQKGQKVSEENSNKEPTDAQINYVKKLKGDSGKAGLMSRGEVSLYIDELKNCLVKAPTA
jgi:5-methylcytosine-specific restriction endonuclease McrA